MTEDHPTPLIKIALTGATGLLGRAVIAQLGATPTRLRRILRPPQQPGADDAMWNPATLELEDTALEGVDAVIHLAGESLAGGRWTAARKRRIRDSRVKGTHLIAQAVARARPTVCICASAVGLYGPTGETLVDEVSPSGKGFLAEVCEAWEAAAAPARDAGVRTVFARMGIVLSSSGGALYQMLPAFRLGLGGPLGPGTQYLSWVSLDDAARALLFLAHDVRQTGPFNITAPEAVTQAAFAETLGRLLNRPARLRLPASLLRLVFGELADATLLCSTRAAPTALLKAGFDFRHPSLETALAAAVALPSGAAFGGRLRGPQSGMTKDSHPRG